MSEEMKTLLAYVEAELLKLTPAEEWGECWDTEDYTNMGMFFALKDVARKIRELAS